MIANEPTRFTAESGHWYRLRDGAPMYEMIGSTTGRPRPTTLRDFKKLFRTPEAIVPSVTGIIDLCAKPGLERWKMEQTMLAALTLPRIDGEDEKSFLSRIIQDSKEQARAAAERGTKIHAAVQAHFQGDKVDPSYMPYVEAVCDKIYQICPGPWKAEESFAHPLLFGGKTDLHCPTAVVDVKTKEFTADNVPDAYDEHAMQLPAYAVGLGLCDEYLRTAEGEDVLCVNVFLSATVPGLAHMHVWEQKDVRRGWRMFQALLDFWKARNLEEGSL